MHNFLNGGGFEPPKLPSGYATDHCRCPTCRTVGKFQRDREMDAAVAGLMVSCPFVDLASGTACRWTGRLEHFDEHGHIVDDEELEKQPPAADESRGTKRRRSDEDQDDDDDDVEVPPAPKVLKLGNATVTGFSRIRITRDGLQFSA